MRDVLSGYMYGNTALHYLLWEYEESIQPKGYKIGGIIIDKEQIEHISPQIPTDGNALESGYEVDEHGLYTEEFVKIHLHCIGNLMLISGTHKASIGNVKFTEKLNSYKQSPLLKQQSEISSFVNNEFPEWTHVHFEERKRYLISLSNVGI